MKKFLLILALLILALLPFVAAAQPPGQCPVPNQCYTDKLTFEIIAPDGTVVDRTVYERLIGLSYNEAMALKYIRLFRNVESGAKSFLDMLQYGTAIEPMKKALEP